MAVSNPMRTSMQAENQSVLIQFDRMMRAPPGWCTAGAYRLTYFPFTMEMRVSVICFPVFMSCQGFCMVTVIS